MPAPGTSGKIPEIRYTVTGFLRMEAMARENTVSASVAIRFGTVTPRSKPRNIRYTTQPIAPASPQKISSDLGAPKRSANESVATRQTMICTIMLKMHVYDPADRACESTEDQL